MRTTFPKLFLFIVAISFSFTAKAALPLAEKEWTFLLFLNGHNNLASYGDMNLKDMEKTGSTDQLNLVVEWGKAGTSATKRLLMQKSTDPSRVTSPAIMSLENHDMGDYRNLVDFVKWGIDNFPARHYMVAIWNHGSGWHFENLKKAQQGAVGVNDISFDDDSGNHITTEQLGLAMAEIKQYLGRNVDIYGSDACLMAMIEVAAEMKDSVDYMVGSEETEPGEGWPYAPWMQRWASAPQSTPAEVSVMLSKEYLKAYSGGVYGNRPVTFSAMDLSKVDAVIASSAKVAEHLKNMSAADLKKIKSGLAKVQDYYYSDYKDYGDFLKVVGNLQIPKDAKLLEKAADDVMSLVITVDSAASYKKSTGVSIWLPEYGGSSYMARYKGLAYDQASKWSGLLEKLLQ